MGAAVGIVGTSGAGKTTVVDILLGLLEIKTGGVYADGVSIKENYRSWLKNVVQSGGRLVQDKYLRIIVERQFQIYLLFCAGLFGDVYY